VERFDAVDWFSGSNSLNSEVRSVMTGKMPNRPEAGCVDRH